MTQHKIQNTKYKIQYTREGKQRELVSNGITEEKNGNHKNKNKDKDKDKDKDKYKYKYKVHILVL